MSATISTGPTVSAGPLLAGIGAPDNNLQAGPGGNYQGDCVIDPRFYIPGGADRPGLIFSFLDSPYVLMANGVPGATGTANIAALQNVTSGTALTLAAASAGVTPAVPFLPLSSTGVGGVNYLSYGSGPVTSGVTLDYGFTTLATTAGSTTATVAAGTLNPIYAGQWLVIGNVGNAGGTIALITYITTVSGSTITLANAPLATQAAAPVGSGNLLDPTAVGATAIAWQPRLLAGLFAPMNPLEAMTRGVSITGVASATGGVFLVRGYDIYGMAMSEAITHAGGATTKYGRKAFKHIASITPQFTDAHTYSAGTSDVVGFNLRYDQWDYANAFLGGGFLSAATGSAVADLTSPATTTTGDVRGTLQMGPAGTLGSGASGSSLNGSTRVSLFTSVPLYNLVTATPTNPAPLFGVTQA